MIAKASARESTRASDTRPAPFFDFAFAALALALLCGALLAAYFDPRDAYGSIAGWLLAHPFVSFVRNAHYWAAQAFLVFGALHVWDRLRAATARRIPLAAWSAAVALIPIVALLLLSGFVLRGDADAREVQRMFGNLLVPAPLNYATHIALAALAALVLLAPPRRRPRALPAAAVVVLVVAASLFVSPGLHDGRDPMFRGPWYFIGVQQIAQWAAQPATIAAAAIGALLLLWWMPRLSTDWARRARRAFVLLGASYFALCGVGVFVQGEAGSRHLRWPDSPGDLHAGWVLRTTARAPAALPVVRGRAEGCLVCHDKIAGLGDAHAPARIGCAACHGGDPFALDATRAHAGLVLVPGNLADASVSCGQSGCHLGIPPRVENSIMTTMAGVVSVDRRVLGEPVNEHEITTAAHLGHSVADSHLRELCVSCHLGQPKTEWGAIGQESRGGGCNACHLVYGADATAELARYLGTPKERRTSIPQAHPRLTVNPGNEHCFGCHSRSSRISTSYEGWNELSGAAPAAIDPARIRKLDDGRFFERVVPDIHHERGLDCIDCHTSQEVMGSGVLAARKSEQLRIGCADCHAQKLASVDPAALDPETRTLLALRNWTLTPPQRLGATRGGDPLVNVIVDADGRGELRRKRTGELLPLAPPLPVCTQGGGHARLTCASCHSAWAPHCTSCHTEFDPTDVGYDNVDHDWVRGTWNETAGPFEAAPPTLGVRTHRDAGGRTRSEVDTMIPGMILTFDRNREQGKPPDVIFRRLYAATFAHTIRREARDCRSCHSDPLALGYGRGRLVYDKTSAGGRWRFEPARPPSPQDGLPADAWIGFLKSRDGMVSTRDDVRPFNVDEQRRMLRVGACLTCHDGNSAVMQRAITDFDGTLARVSKRCVLPVWP